MKILFICLIFLKLGISPSIAADFFRLSYRVKSDETFAEILKKFVKDDSVINSKSPSIIKTKRYNPQIKNWQKLVAETEIKLFIEPVVMDLKKYKEYESSILEEIELSKRKFVNKKFTSSQSLKSSIFYMASTGQFDQTLGKTHISFKQNSLLTLGGAFVFFPRESPFSTSVGLYVSTFTNSATTINDDIVKIPPEIGLNLYEEYRLTRFGTTIYGGFDFEQFSTFDLDYLATYNKIQLLKNSIGYLTIGLSKSFNISNKTFYTKASFSKSITSKVSMDIDEYKGSKFLFYINYKFNDKLYFHSLLKYHKMDGVDKLLVLRVGVGVGYVLF